MEQKTPVKPEQSSAQESPWSDGDRAYRLLWEFCWFVFCVWTPKPANPWRLFWLDVSARRSKATVSISRTIAFLAPYFARRPVSRPRNATSGRIEIGARATVAQERISHREPIFPPAINRYSQDTIGGTHLSARRFVMPGGEIGGRSVIGAGRCDQTCADFCDRHPCKVLSRDDRPRSVLVCAIKTSGQSGALPRLSALGVKSS